MYFLPETLAMCFSRLDSQLALSGAERANTWNDLLAWLIWNAWATSGVGGEGVGEGVG